MKISLRPRVYFSGPAIENLEPIIIDTMGLRGVEVQSPAPGGTAQESYEGIMDCDSVLMVYRGSAEETIEMSIELGIAIALGKPVYVAIATPFARRTTNRFLHMEGVRIFSTTVEAMDAVLADLPGEGNDMGLEGYGLEAGGDAGELP